MAKTRTNKRMKGPDPVETASPSTSKKKITSNKDNNAVFEKSGGVTRRSSGVEKSGGVTRRSSGVEEREGVIRRSSGVEKSEGVTRRSSGVEEREGVIRRSSGVEKSGGVTRRSSGDEKSGGVTRRSSGVEKSGGVTRRSSGVEKSGGVTRGSSGVKKSGGVTRRSSGVEKREGVTRRSSGVEKSGGVTRRSSGVEERDSVTRRSSGVEKSGGVTRRTPGVEKSGGVARRIEKSLGLKLTADNDSVSSRDTSSKTNSSSPYDFMEDSPKTDPHKKSEKVKSGAKKVNKTKSTKTLPKSKDNSTTGSSKSSKPLPKTGSSGKMKSSTITPKSRLTKPVLKEEIEQSDIEQQKRKRILKAIPPLNLDDISPIIRGRRSNTSAKMEGSKNVGKQDKDGQKALRQSPRVKTSSLTSSTSFTESVDQVADPNDSALFLSPRKTMPRFSTGKTSTPADLPVKVKSRTAAVKKLSKNSLKNTSTPNEIKPKPKRDFTHIKENISKLSPVQRTETPTSDYASMDSFMTPSPVAQTKQSRKRRGSSPAFTLEDDSEESLDLNKSVNQSYKKTKRKYEVSKHHTSKVDEWADRVNSELEDVENFELSVEG